jgi:L-2-hydroxyglutarate oxidase LhgO
LLQPQIRLVTPEEVQQLEPNLNKTSRRLVGGLFSPDEYLVDTWLLAISYLYSALQNGCDLHLNCEVVDCRYSGGQWAVEARSSSSQQTSRFTAGVVINCAGNYSDAMHEILSGERGSDSFRITPGKGEFLVFESGTPQINQSKS